MATTTLSAAAAIQRPDWVAAWGSAQMPLEGKDPALVAASGPVTIRQIVHLSADGNSVRIRLSNVAGDRPLAVTAATLARARASGDDGITQVRPLTFSGATVVTIPAGAELYSDPVPLTVAAGDDVAISLFLTAPSGRLSGHPGARATTFITAGNQSATPALTAPRRIGGWWWLADVEVAESTRTGTLVAIGDSITDGRGIVDDSNARWTDALARRLAAVDAPVRWSVVNAGIGGNRILRDGIGPSLIGRFDRDVLGRSGVRAAIVLEGVNDLGVATRDAPADPATHRELVAAITTAYRQIANRAHARGIAVFGGTITPYGGNDYYHPDARSEADRQAINTFIRASGTFDGVLDFDGALHDPARPDRLLPRYDSGDHLHPSPEGYRAMAAAVPLMLFARGCAAADCAPTGKARSSRPRIAITFDDIPAHGALPAGATRLGIARSIIATLAAHRSPAFGFMNAGFGDGVADAPQVLAAWRGAGLPIGNHGYGHLDLAQVGASSFLADVARNEGPLAAAAGAHDWHWFRYPFLSEGQDFTTRSAVRTGLRNRGYRVAAVTMSFADYAWNGVYARCLAKRDAAAIGMLETSYLDAARRQALRSRELAHDALGRDIPYVLLMHLGAFDARMLSRLLTLYEQMGFAFTTLPAAEADPFYMPAVDLALPGPSPTLEAAARAKGVPVPPDTPLPADTMCR
ncbi:GDSL-type esterase/lipase family protein [Sphingomonas sp. XXL09]|uniref:GDSL-type esterase/lipase family protein n=1 Tax=Sphingomonas sp. XXL09 TaxID=3457787 RepID=UPI00406BD8E5